MWGAADCHFVQSVDQLDWNGAADNVQTALDVAGLIPGIGEPFDAANAAISAARGDYVAAGLSAAAMVPLAGGGATTGKLIAKYGDEAAAIVSHADEAASVVPVARVPHRNARDSTAPSHVYEILETNQKTGATSTWKYGVGSDPLNADGSSSRAMEQVGDLNRIKGPRVQYSSRVLAYNIPKRQLAYDIEQGLVDRYAMSNPRGYYGPPGNVRPKPTPR